MFYHVLVETNEKDKNDRNRKYHEFDIQDKTKLIDKYAIPYLKEQTLRIDGYSIKNACRFVVTQSDVNTETIVGIVKEYNKSDPFLALFYSREKASKRQSIYTRHN